MNGAVAAGSKPTVAAGLEALRKGGNAVDAAIASTLMAGVAEPLLSGLGGSGIATVRFDGVTGVCDFFADMPGVADRSAPDAAMDSVSIDFGPTTQNFLVGPGSASVPGLPGGLWALHERYGTLPMSVLAIPAIETARQGVTVTPGFERVLELLWPIVSRTAGMRALFSRNGERLKAGDTYVCHALSDTLASYASAGPDYFRTGDGAQAFLSEIQGQSRISAADFMSQRTIFRQAHPAGYRDAVLWVPGPPSAAGIGVAHTLAALEVQGEPREPTGLDSIRSLETALGATTSMRGKAFLRDLFTEGFGPAFMQRVDALRNGKHPGGAGYTTHISTVDGAGNAVAITHSLGETAGVLAGDSGVIINNFLGEADVNPPFLRRPAGSRLVTMCCPSILELADGTIVSLGSGGSSRIPTAVVHGVTYMVDHGWTVSQAVRGPRTHIEGGRLHVESDGRTDQTMEAMQREVAALVRFDGPNMFFGGLHAASFGPGGFDGCGDARRSGAFGVVP